MKKLRLLSATAIILLSVQLMASAQNNSVPVENGGQQNSDKFIEKEYYTPAGTFTFSVKESKELKQSTHESLQYTEDKFTTTDGGSATFLVYETNNIKEEQASLQKDAEITIYPNPLSTSATVTINSELKIQNCELKIYDMLGKEVGKIAVVNRQSTIERGNLQEGIYIYEVMSEGQILGRGKLTIINE